MWFPVFHWLLYAKNSGVEPAGRVPLFFILWNPPTYQKRVRRLQMRLPRSGLADRKSLAILGLAAGRTPRDFHLKSILSSNARAGFASDAMQFEAMIPAVIFSLSCYQWLLSHYCQDSDWWRSNFLYWDDLRCHSGAFARFDGLCMELSVLALHFFSYGGFHVHGQSVVNGVVNTFAWKYHLDAIASRWLQISRKFVSQGAHIVTRAILIVSLSCRDPLE